MSVGSVGADDGRQSTMQAVQTPVERTGDPARGGQPPRGSLNGARTLRITELLHTKVQSVRIELVGGEDSLLDRLGTWLLFMPFLFIGYVLLVASAVSAAHTVLGWGPSLFLIGAGHVAVGLWGVARARRVGLVTRAAVLEPKVAGASSAARAAQDEIPQRLRKTPLPLPFRTADATANRGSTSDSIL